MTAAAQERDPETGQRIAYNVSAWLRQRILERDDWTCLYCGLVDRSGHRLEVDHILARANGGTARSDNLATACRPCNQVKSDRPADTPPEPARLLNRRQRRIAHLLEIEAAGAATHPTDGAAAS